MVCCFVSDSYPLNYPFGGIAVYTQTAAQTLCAHGNEVHVIVGWHGKKCDVMDGSVHVHYRTVRWLPVVGKFLPGLGESLCLAREIRELNKTFRFDIVEFPNFEGRGLAFQAFSALPVVVRLHTSMLESVEVKNRPSTFGERYMMWAERQSSRRALGVVTHSRSHRDKLGKFYGLPRIHLIEHGIHPPKVRIEEPSSLSVLTIGRLNDRKGGATLLASIARVYEQFPNATFTIVGATKEEQIFCKFRDANPSIPYASVVCRGFVANDELDELYDAATIYVSASNYESFGLTFVEAMARGIPVVGCGVSAMNEIIRHESTGLLVPPGDAEAFAAAIIRLLRDVPLRIRMGQEARRVALEKYSAARMGAEIGAWYRTVLNDRVIHPTLPTTYD